MIVGVVVHRFYSTHRWGNAQLALSSSFAARSTML
jgi:hypothetical protein